MLFFIFIVIIYRIILSEWGNSSNSTVIRIRLRSPIPFYYYYYFTVMVILYCRHGWVVDYFVPSSYISCSFCLVLYCCHVVRFTFLFYFPSLFLLSHFLHFCFYIWLLIIFINNTCCLLYLFLFTIHHSSMNLSIWDAIVLNLFSI